MAIAVCPQCGGPLDHEAGRCPTDGTMITSSEVHGSDRVVVGASREGRGGSLRGSERELQAVGKTVGKYVLESIIGRGGMGTVYKARHVELESRVAIKVLDPRYSASAEIVTRFFHEAKAAAQIGHPNIVQVLDFSRNTDVGDFIVMELLEGATLGDVLDATPQLKETRVLRVGMQMADALTAAHKRGIIHRDLKPANVFLSVDQGRERVTVMDFGVAKISEARTILETLPGAVMGTPQYMSPEQWDGKDVDARSDVYSLGVVLYEAATGVLPFKGKTFAEIVKLQATSPIKAPREIRNDLHAETEAVILRCLAMDPDARYATMEDLGADLRAAREIVGRSVSMTASGADGAILPRIKPKPRRGALSKVLWLAPGAALLVILGLTWLVSARLARDERAAAAAASPSLGAPLANADANASSREPAPTAVTVQVVPTAASAAAASSVDRSAPSPVASAKGVTSAPSATTPTASPKPRPKAPPPKPNLLFTE